MKRKWTRGEKLLWAAPLIFLIGAAVAAWGPEVLRKQLGRPTVLRATAPKGSSLRSIALSSDGALLAASCSESSNPKINGGDILFWDAHTLKPLSLGKSNSVDIFNNGNAQRTDNFAFALAPDAKTLGFYRRVLMPNGAVQPFTLYDVATGKARWKLSGTDWINTAHFSPDGQTIGITHGINKHDMEVVFLRVADGTVTHRWTVPQVWTDTTNFAWAPDGKTIVTVGNFPAPLDKYGRQTLDRYRFEVRRADDGKILYFWATRRVNNFDLSPDGRSLIAVTYEQEGGANVKFRAAVIDIMTRRERWQFGDDDSENRPLAARFAPDGVTIAVRTSRWKERVLFIDSQTGQVKRTLSTSGAPINSVSNSTGLIFAPDGKRLYARGQNAVLVWDLD